jgi:hypothetical protein
MQKKYLFIWFLIVNISTFAQKQSGKLNACYLVKGEINFKQINDNAREIILNGKDECVIKLLDKIYDSTKTTNYYPSFKALSTICSISDGYVSEYLTEISFRLVINNFNNLFAYIYKPNSKLNTALEKFIIEGIALHINNSKNIISEKKKIFTYLVNQKKRLNMSNLQIVYIDKLIKKVEYFMVDDK